MSECFLWGNNKHTAHLNVMLGAVSDKDNWRWSKMMSLLRYSPHPSKKIKTPLRNLIELLRISDWINCYVLFLLNIYADWSRLLSALIIKAHWSIEISSVLFCLGSYTQLTSWVPSRPASESTFNTHTCWVFSSPFSGECFVLVDFFSP